MEAQTVQGYPENADYCIRHNETHACYCKDDLFRQPDDSIRDYSSLTEANAACEKLASQLTAIAEAGLHGSDDLPLTGSLRVYPVADLYSLEIDEYQKAKNARNKNAK